MGTVEDVVIGCLRGIIPPEKHDPWAEKLLAKAIATALREAGLVREWEPIETAPKDGLRREVARMNALPVKPGL